MTNKKLDFINISFVDLTQVLSASVPHWGSGCGFRHNITVDYDDCNADMQFRVQSIEMSAGIGTHMDAPAHCVRGATDIASIPLEQLIAPCVMIDVSAKAHENYRVVPEDIRDFESQHGIINRNSLVIIHTGWGKLWSSPNKYRNNLIFPTISTQATELLLERDIVGLGIDTLSPDNETDGFPVHRLVLGADKYLIENIANANLVPPVDAYILALPLKIHGGTESPIRLVAAIAL